MKSISQLVVIIFCVVVAFSGCEQRMTKPIMEVITQPQVHIEKARTAVQKVNHRRNESQQRAEAAGNYSTVFIDSEVILQEELGFEKAFWVELVDIYRTEKADSPEIVDGFDNLQDAFAIRLEENTLGQFYYNYIRTFDTLIVEYLRLSYVYPTHGQDALLGRFRQSVRDGRVSITFPENF